MLATPSRTLSPSRPRSFRALRNWLWLLMHRTRRYRIMRAYAAETLRSGPMAVPSPSTMATPSTSTTDLTLGAERRFPLQRERAARFYRALDEHD